MNLVYYKAIENNFGDDLNPFVFKKILGDFKNYKDVDFVGIGSIIDERLTNDKFKVVFGSGLRDVNYKCNFDKFDIRFLRGPLSSRFLGNKKFITDSAYLLGLLDFKKPEKKHKLSFMPYYKLMKSYNWKLFQTLTGINIIDPTNNVEDVINDILSSKKVISTAMHGAIVADVFRIPWNRFHMPHTSEESFFSEFKWKDWLQSIEIDQIYGMKSSLAYANNSKYRNTIPKTLQLVELFLKIKKNNQFHISSDEVFNDKLNKLSLEVKSFKQQYSL